MGKTKNIRLSAAQIIAALIGGRGSLTTHLSDFVNNETLEIEKDVSLLKHICYGVARYFPRLEFIASQLLKKPFKKKDADIYALVLIGIYQIFEMRIKDHAAVSETVNAVKLTEKGWATGLVNGVLRNCIRQKDDLAIKIDKNESAKLVLPQWFIDKIKRIWPEDYISIAESFLTHPPMSLRVNSFKTEVDEYLQMLQNEGIEAKEIIGVKDGINIEFPLSVDKTPGFNKGLVSVQDGSAQYAAQLLDVKNEMKILDACAAPGGKSCHILELAPQAKLTAIDCEEERLVLVEQNLDRLQFSAELICADACAVDKWWNGEKFDRILLDAPCSGTGVIRRNPDIKITRNEKQIKQLIALQRSLLQALWPLLNDDGLLLYATCSIIPQENDEQIKGWLASNKEAKRVDINLASGHPLPCGWQILPGMNNLDGFYYALMRKAAIDG